MRLSFLVMVNPEADIERWQVFFSPASGINSNIIFFDMRPSDQSEVNFVTALRTRGATTNTVGNAIGHGIANPLNQWAGKSGPKPWVTSTTAPEITVTMIIDNRPPKRTLLYRAGILMEVYRIRLYRVMAVAGKSSTGIAT